MARTFEDVEAKRSRVPLLIGLVGPSGGGKTYSALRLATGIQRVVGGEIFGVDTEARRMLHYADKFKFRHVPFAPPFSPLDYLAAIEHCSKKGASVVIVDSASHEHEGPGGVLEMHAAEIERMTRTVSDERERAKKAERVKMLAWSKPKQERRRMINSILQLPVTSIFCFRAKEKLKIVPGKEPETLGFMAIAGDEFIYEMTLNALLLPNANGIGTWQSKEIGERQQIKLPEQFRQLLTPGVQFSEDIGESMAKWSEGGAVSRFGELAAEIERADLAALELIVPKIEDAKKKRTINPTEMAALRNAFAGRKAALSAPPKSDPIATTANGEAYDPTTGEVRPEDEPPAAAAEG